MLLSHALRAAQKITNQIEYVNLSTAAINSTTLTLAKPVNTLPGDLVVLVFTTQTTQSIILQSGWTTIASQHNITSDLRTLLLYRTVPLSEVANYTVQLGAARAMQGVVLTYRNAKYNTFSGVVNARPVSSLSVSLAPQSAASVIIHYSALQNSFPRTSVPIPGFTELAEFNVAGTSIASNLQVSHVVPVGAADTTDVSNTWSIAGGMAAAMIELVPK